MTELMMVCRQLEKARCPEDVFGKDGRVLRHQYRYLARVVHPDVNGNAVEAHKATGMLNRLKTIADERVANGTYGDLAPLPEYAKIQIGGYTVGKTPLVGDVADLYFGDDEVVKVARSVDDNDLMRAEQSTLKTLRNRIFPPVREGIPRLLSTFQVDHREASVMQRLSKDFVTATEVRSRLPDGVDERVLVWTFKRLLVVLEWSHYYGIVHGAVLPPHVMLYPDNADDLDVSLRTVDSKVVSAAPQPYKHTIRLVDWCYSVEYKTRTRLSAWLPAWESHYPPELLLKQAVAPASDIYMAAKLIVYLAGGASELPEMLFAVLRKCLQSDLNERYQKVSDVFADWQKAAELVYGPPKWVDFNLPT